MALDSSGVRRTDMPGARALLRGVFGLPALPIKYIDVLQKYLLTSIYFRITRMSTIKTYGKQPSNRKENPRGVHAGRGQQHPQY